MCSGITLTEVDWSTSDVLRLLQTLSNTVHDVDLGCTAKYSGIRRHEADRTSTEDGNGLARFESRELNTVPSLRVNR